MILKTLLHIQELMRAAESSQLIKLAVPTFLMWKKKIRFFACFTMTLNSILASAIEDHIGRFHKSFSERPLSSIQRDSAGSSGRIIPGFSGWTFRRREKDRWPRRRRWSDLRRTQNVSSWTHSRAMPPPCPAVPLSPMFRPGSSHRAIVACSAAAVKKPYSRHRPIELHHVTKIAFLYPVDRSGRRSGISGKIYRKGRAFVFARNLCYAGLGSSSTPEGGVDKTKFNSLSKSSVIIRSGLFMPDTYNRYSKCLRCDWISNRFEGGSSER